MMRGGGGGPMDSRLRGNDVGGCGSDGDRGKDDEVGVGVTEDGGGGPMDSRLRGNDVVGAGMTWVGAGMTWEGAGMTWWVRE